MVARDSNTANAFETTLTAEMNASTLTATVSTTTGGPASPCYLVIEPDDNNQREYIYFDDTFTGTTFVSTALANRYLAGSAAGSGLTHPVGSVVRSAPVAQHFEDLHDRIDGVASPITTRGDIIRGDASGDPERLALGTAGQHLESDGTDVVWATPATDPITTRGDLIRGDATGDAERLALGTTGQVVQSDGTDVAWATLDTSDLSDVDFTGLATGAVAYYDGTDWIDLAIGTADQVLAVNTGATAPEWATATEGNTTAVVKTSDESVTSSTTLQDDDALTLSVAASTNYSFRAYLSFTSGSTGDIKLTFTVPSGATIHWMAHVIESNGVASTQAFISGANPVTASGTTIGVQGSTDYQLLIHGSVRVSTTAGNLLLRWAQNTSDATATTIKAGSTLMINREA